LKAEILTLFPEIFSGFLESSLIKKATEKGLFSPALTQIRDFSDPPHYQVDDTPYGGGAGMLMKAEPLGRAIEDAKFRLPRAKVVLLSPCGQVFNQQLAHSLSKHEELIFVCGRYEGIDERIVELYVDYSLSIGDFVLMGGEVAAMLVIEASLRLVPGVLGNSESLTMESFSHSNLLEAPQYTRPPTYKGLTVPDVLLSGNHQLIEKWRKEQAKLRTKKIRPELTSDD